MTSGTYTDPGDMKISDIRINVNDMTRVISDMHAIDVIRNSKGRHGTWGVSDIGF